MDSEVRKAKLNDLENIRELNEASWKEAYNGIIPEEKLEENIGNYPEERLRKKIEDDKLLFLVAEVDGEVVGTINFCWGEDNTHDFVDVDEGEAQLRAVYLHPDHWGKGIGTKMFEQGIEKIPECINVMKVESLKENDIGRGFYRNLGFEKLDEDSVEIFGDEYESVILRKDLPESKNC